MFDEQENKQKDRYTDVLYVKKINNRWLKNKVEKINSAFFTNNVYHNHSLRAYSGSELLGYTAGSPAD